MKTSKQKVLTAFIILCFKLGYRKSVFESLLLPPPSFFRCFILCLTQSCVGLVVRLSIALPAPGRNSFVSGVEGLQFAELSSAQNNWCEKNQLLKAEHLL